MRTRSPFHVLAFLVLAASLASCGGGGSGGGNNTPPSSGPNPPPPPPQATVTFLHDFRADLGDGNGPNGPLVQASDGNFYGTTLGGGTEVCRPVAPIPCGVIFRLTPDGTESVFYAFGSIPNDGYTPVGALLEASDGALYGVTSNGGDYGGGGTVFKITLDGAYTVLHSFGGTADDGVVPVGGLIQATDGNFYGVTASGGANHCLQIPQGGGNCGTIFKMTRSGETTILYSFGTSISDGVEPLARLLQASDGNFYGTTVTGGANACTTTNETNNCGTLFMMTPTGETTVLHSFGPTYRDPIAPLSGLIEGTDGALYGTTVSGGGGNCNFAFSCGAVYRITMAGELTILYAFALTSIEDGYGPSQLILASDGNFYGTTGSGGAQLGGDLEGTAFKLTPAGVLTTLYSFGPLHSKASNPVGGLVEGNDGAFYGLTAYSDSFPGTGSVFKLVRP